jgi:hypothetical protein
MQGLRIMSIFLCSHTTQSGPIKKDYKYTIPIQSYHYPTIQPSMALQPFVEPSPFFSFLILHTVSMSPWDGASASRKASTYTQNKRTQTSMPWMGFEPTTPVLWAAEHGSCLRPRGHCDRQSLLETLYKGSPSVVITSDSLLNCCWPSPAQVFLVPQDSWLHFTVWRLWKSSKTLSLTMYKY